MSISADDLRREVVGELRAKVAELTAERDRMLTVLNPYATYYLCAACALAWRLTDDEVVALPVVPPCPRCKLAAAEEEARVALYALELIRDGDAPHDASCPWRDHAASVLAQRAAIREARARNKALRKGDKP